MTASRLSTGIFVKRVRAFLTEWDEAIHADPSEHLRLQVQQLEERVAGLEASQTLTANLSRSCEPIQKGT